MNSTKFFGLMMLSAFAISTQAQDCWQKVDNQQFTPVLLGEVVHADIDNDGDRDVLITGSSGNNIGSTKLYTNDNRGNFTEVLGTPFEPIERSSATFADVDGDNDQDVIIIGEKAGVTKVTKLYLNDGNGVFTEDTQAPFYQVRYGYAGFSDVDSDGDLDVLITGEKTGGDRTSILYFNDGNGGFTESANNAFAGVYYGPMAFGDIDGDNDQDVVISGYTHMLINGVKTSVFSTKLYTNDGTGIFTEVTSPGLRQVADGAIAFSDIDGDNDLDLLMTGKIVAPTGRTYVATELYLNDGSGKFTSVPNDPFEDVGAGSVSFADIDNDGDEDVLISGHTATAVIPDRVTKLYANDGMGNFAGVEGTPFDTVRYGSSAFFDADSDGDLDLLLLGQKINGNQRVTNLYLNCNSLTTGTSIAAQNSALAYPNPTHNNLTLSGDYEYTIYNSMGNQVLSGKGISVSLEYFPDGVYWLEIDGIKTKILKY